MKLLSSGMSKNATVVKNFKTKITTVRESMKSINISNDTGELKRASIATINDRVMETFGHDDIM